MYKYEFDFSCITEEETEKFIMLFSQLDKAKESVVPGDTSFAAMVNNAVYTMLMSEFLTFNARFANFIVGEVEADEIGIVLDDLLNQFGDFVAEHYIAFYKVAYVVCFWQQKRATI